MLAFIVLNVVFLGKLYFFDVPSKNFTSSNNAISASTTDVVSPSEPTPPPVEFGCNAAKVYAMDKYTVPLISSTPVVWSSSDEEVATVDSYGTVTTHKAGTVTISAVDNDGNDAQCILNVVKVAYLTIDDNPNYTWTPKILEILRKYDIKATFFLCASLQKRTCTNKYITRGTHLLFMDILIT